MNVLIVDDQPCSRMILRCVLQKLDMELSVHEFGDPEAALRWTESSPADFILLDYRMPEMDGLEFAKQFRAHPEHRDVPIMLVTGADEANLRQAAAETGIIDFMAKPVRPRDLHTRCQNLLLLRKQSVQSKRRVDTLEEQLVAARQVGDKLGRA